MSINTPAPPGPLPTDPPHPCPGPGEAQVRIRRLHHDGSTNRADTSLAPATAPDLARSRPTRVAAAATLTVTGDDAPRARLDATGTRLRLRALHVMGHNCVRIARALDVSETAIRELVRSSVRTVSPELRDAVADLYDAWWDKRAPARTRFERGAATLARRRAIAGNWCAGAALDDDLLDIPGYQPTWGYRMSGGLIRDVFDVLERHGYRQHDNQHTAQAIGVIADLASIYDGTHDASSGSYFHQAPSAQYAEPGPPGPEADDAVILTDAEVSTVFGALEIAADYKRDRAASCSYCADQHA